jgi:hypothetical protein
MADRTFASLAPRLQPSVPGCPQPTIIQYIRASAIRTCERTLGWRHAEPPYALMPGVHQYAYRKPIETDVHAVFAANVNDYPLQLLTLDQALERYPQWADLYGGVPYDELWAGSGSLNEDAFNEAVLNDGPEFALTDAAMEKSSDPRAFTQLTPDQFVVLPSPDDTKQYLLRLVYALKPKRMANAMPAAIFDELEDAIMHGALQELLVLPNVSWSDRELAAYHAKQYLFHVTERRARANLGNARGTLMVKMQPFG